LRQLTKPVTDQTLEHEKSGVGQTYGHEQANSA